MGDNLFEFSVTELSTALKRTVEDGFSHVRVRAEISGLKRAASGHLYMTLKDEKSVIDGVCWRGVADKLSFRPEDGLEVICSGKVTVYPARSKYQIVIDRIEPAGVGALMALLEERKKTLAAEGLFEEGRKKQLPFIPKIIGVVTSPTGAVIRDILHRLNDRFPRHVIVWPVQVQGETAAPQIAKAIEGFNNMEEGGKTPKPDLIIVARGGGSLEDLWAFNEEVVVRATAESDIPIISAVGHETDTTLIDFVSDLRAPTPTAAAELAVPVLADLNYTILDLDRRMVKGKSRYFENLKNKIEGLARGIPHPRDILGVITQRMDDLSDRLPRALKGVTQVNSVKLERSSSGLSLTSLRQMVRLKETTYLDVGKRLPKVISEKFTEKKTSLSGLSRVLETLSHKKVLDRGFAVLYGEAGAPITSAKAVEMGEILEIELKDGLVEAYAKRGKVPQKARVKGASKPKSKDNDKQGSLL